MAFSESYRDFKEWESIGLKLTTPSDEACKLFDAGVSQAVSWRENELFGGIDGTLGKLRQSDPNFVMGRVLDVGITLLGTGESSRISLDLRNKLDDVRQLSITQRETLTARELQHVDAILKFGDGNMSGATRIWEQILSKHPRDMLAIKLAHDCYFYLGKQRQMRDSILRVMPDWKESDPLYSFLYGMLGFGYVETSMFDKAEEYALKGLSFNRNDAWSTHALAHVYEMRGEPDAGIAFMSKTLQDWEVCGMLACHNFWHWAVYHIEKGEHEAAVELFDGQIGSRAASSGAMLDYVDAASLLYRLELDGASVPKERWSRVFDVCKQHLSEHITVFNDVHYYMNLLGMKDVAREAEFREDLQKFAFFNDNPICEYVDNIGITKKIGCRLLAAMKAYSNKEFDECTCLLNGCRYDVVEIGGSDAQRDLFHLLLINAAAQSQGYRELAKQLLYERAALRRDSPMVKRLKQRFCL